MKALIVIDMQNDFIDGSLGSEQAKAIVPNVVNKINSWDDKIIATQDTHQMNYLSTFEGQRLPVEHCISSTSGWFMNADIYDALSKKQNYTMLKKPTFGSLSIPQYITDCDEIEICGLCTDICVISNALILRAAYPNKVIKCDASCCAGVTEEKHKAALEVMKSCQIDVYND